MFKFGKLSWLLLLVPFILFACIQNVTIQENNDNREVVLNCILDSGKDTVTVQLTYSISIQSTLKFEAIKNATIQLFEEGESVGEFVWADSSAYILPISVVPEKTYRIEVKIESKMVWAETTIPKTVDATIEKANAKRYSYLISLKDNPEENNYYWTSATGYEGTEDNQHKNIACMLYSNFEYADDFNQTIYQNESYKFEYEYYIRFTNNEFPNGETEIVFLPQCIHEPIEVFLLSTDYHLDKYMKSSLLLQNMDLFAEEMPIVYSPFPVYSNIHGGTGIFGSFSCVSNVFTKK